MCLQGLPQEGQLDKVASPLFPPACADGDFHFNEIKKGVQKGNSPRGDVYTILWTIHDVVIWCVADQSLIRVLTCIGLSKVPLSARFYCLIQDWFEIKT